MPAPDEEKIELLVRSVLAAVDARLLEVRNEFHELADQVEQRHREALQHMQDLERRLERRATDAAASAGGGDPLAARMEQATQVLLERIEAMHQRSTIATNERFALINDAISQLRGDHAAAAVAVPVMPSLDAMSAPLRVGPPTGQYAAVDACPQPAMTPAQAPVPASTTPVTTTSVTTPATAAAINAPIIAPATPAPIAATQAATTPAAESSAADPAQPPSSGGEIDLAKLADLLGERLGRLNIQKPAN